MSHGEVIIFPSTTNTDIFKPNEYVNLYVCRTNVFGSKVLGDRGLFHSGLLFESGENTWVIDLSIKGNMGGLIPYINNGDVTLDNYTVLEYYSPATKNTWEKYWSNKGKKICSISPSLYKKLIDYILREIGPRYNRYALFSISSKPFYTIRGNKASSTSTIYTSDNTCDKLPMRCFEWLQKEHGVRSEVFPITLILLSIDQKPTLITNMNDNGLVKYTTTIRKYINLFNDFNKIHSKDVDGLYSSITNLQQSDVNILEYVVSLNNDTEKVEWYKLPVNDVSISATDVYFKVSSSKFRCVFIIVLILVLISIVLFLIFRNFVAK